MPIRFQVDPDFYDHPKTLGMSDAATALWVRAGSYSAAKLSDGFVADAALVRLSRTPMEAARELIRCGLWSRVKGGYKFHEWELRNLTRARVEAEKEADRQRKQRSRQNGKPQVGGNAVRPESGPESERSPPGIPVLSVSMSESMSGSGRGSPPLATALSVDGKEPPRQCPDHEHTHDPPPCGACADARRAHDRWQTARNKRINDAPRCRKHRGQLAANCSLCRAERLSPV